jgi:hypothetical protein
VHADEKLTVRVQLESVIRACAEICLDKRAGTFPNSTPLNGSESGGGLFPARFFAPSGPAIPKCKLSGEEENGRTMNPLTQFRKTTVLPFVLLPGSSAIVEVLE